MCSLIHHTEPVTFLDVLMQSLVLAGQTQLVEEVIVEVAVDDHTINVVGDLEGKIKTSCSTSSKEAIGLFSFVNLLISAIVPKNYQFVVGTGIDLNVMLICSILERRFDKIVANLCGVDEDDCIFP